MTLSWTIRRDPHEQFSPWFQLTGNFFLKKNCEKKQTDAQSGVDGVVGYNIKIGIRKHKLRALAYARIHAFFSFKKNYPPTQACSSGLTTTLESDSLHVAVGRILEEEAADLRRASERHTVHVHMQANGRPSRRAVPFPFITLSKPRR